MSDQVPDVTKMIVPSEHTSSVSLDGGPVHEGISDSDHDCADAECAVRDAQRLDAMIVEVRAGETVRVPSGVRLTGVRMITPYTEIVSSVHSSADSLTSGQRLSVGDLQAIEYELGLAASHPQNGYCD